ncbi:MAG TPA: phosphoenolpyruvate carboxykinase (GTP) [candidate division Zixibacteria bacterium]|nr:phosphoenolpyruvate carboxykinase (GTP) [candidate division Zixibacteria bacterium]
MLELKKGDDILSVVGGIHNKLEADELFARTLSKENSDKLSKIKNEEALLKIANAIAMCQPKDVFIHTGSEADKQWVREYSLKKGEEKPLAMKDHTIHFDLPQDQGRLVSQTFYIVNEGEKLSQLAKKIDRSDAMDYVKNYMTGIMSDKIMMVGFFSRGPIGAIGSIPALEISSSTYVLHSADLLYRHCYDQFDREVERKGIFYTNVHSEGPNTPEDIPNARIFMDRSWFTTFSTFCTYAGNTLLLKKGNHRFTVDYVTYYKHGEELSEHMFITGMKGPGGRETYFAGAAPSGCGKTTSAMAGTEFVGDDLAQIWIDDNGICRAVNPEQGIFGIVADVNREGDPFLMKCLREEGSEVIWSNVLIDENNKPHWTGNGEEHPKKGFNFQGEWFEGKTDADGKPIPISHPNSRCTLRCDQIDTYNKKVGESPEGAPVKVFTYSGRDADTMPPIWVSKDADSGVVIGASIVSQATATEVGATGVKRQPWANAPFIPGSLADYMDAQMKFFNNPKFSDEGRPIISGLNYFLTHEKRGSNGKGLLGEKKDVPVWLSWLDRFAHKEVEAIDTPIGWIPKYDDLKKLFKEVIDKDYPEDLYTMQFSLYADNIIARIDLQDEAYHKEENIPERFFEILREQKAGLEALKAKYGSIVKPQDLLVYAS